VTLLPYAGFALVALAAIGFATFAVWRGKSKGKALLALAITLFLLGVGGGTYAMLGQPALAVRAAQGLQTRDVRGFIPLLIARVRKDPADEQAWVYLGRFYLSSGDADDAAKAYGRAIALAPRPDEDLAAGYGVALVAASDGAVTPQAEAAFNEALRLNPKDGAARFYLGQARAARGDRAGALDLWQSLLADVDEKSQLHQVLVDRIALLTAQGIAPGGGAPDPRQMVAGLAARLKDNPDDAAGWQRLIRAYTVLGETDKAKDALKTARSTFAAQKDVLTALGDEAKDLKLE
jgi:cytochrome c-type biogenesis protein CcmH